MMITMYLIMMMSYGIFTFTLTIYMLIAFKIAKKMLLIMPIISLTMMSGIMMIMMSMILLKMVMMIVMLACDDYLSNDKKNELNHVGINLYSS